MKKLTLILSLLIALVGLNANAAMYIVGDAPFGGWNPNGGVQMTDNGGGIYTYTATINGTVFFVFGDGQADWDTFNPNHRYGPANGNEAVTVGVWKTTQKAGDHGAYFFEGSGDDYVFTFDENTHQFKVEGYVAPIVITTYTVVSGLDGEGWPILESNDMTLVNGVYTLTRENVELTAGTLAYKVVGNHDWGHEWPQGYGNNFTQTIPANGTYDITFTFDPETEKSTCTLTLNGEAGEDVYTVTGAPASLFGQEWTPGLEDNVMTLDEETGLYTWSKAGFEATDTTVVEFKVVANGNWNTCWPLSDENGPNNWYYKFEEAGTYDIVITFNEETKEITFTATKQGGEEPVEDTYTVAGTPNLFGSNWDPADTNNDMDKGEDGIYTWTKTDYVVEEADTIEFKVVKNHSWDVASYPENNWWYAATAGTYDFVITFNPETSEVTFTPTKQGGEEPVEMVYTIVGDENVFGSNWDTNDEKNELVKGEDGVYTWSKEDVTLYNSFQFKVVGNHDYAVYEWPVGPYNWVANLPEEDGEGIYDILITFDPEAADSVKITCTLTKVGEVDPIEHVYTVVGPEHVFGSNWDPADEHNNMTLDAETGLYTWRKDNVALTESFGFKVVGDHSWANEWPQGYDNNWIVNIEEAGNYNLFITFNAETGEINCTATKAEPAGLRGDVDGNGEVKIADVTALINYLLSQNPEGINLQNADCDQNGEIKIADVTALINYLLSNKW